MLPGLTLLFSGFPLGKPNKWTRSSGYWRIGISNDPSGPSLPPTCHSQIQMSGSWLFTDVAIGTSKFFAHTN
jgi:hypothetical protein